MTLCLDHPRLLQEYNTKKAQQFFEFATDPDTAMELARCCVLSEPVDLLSASLQHTDEVGHSFSEL